jgi:hypothetical protein
MSTSEEGCVYIARRDRQEYVPTIQNINCFHATLVLLLRIQLHYFRIHTEVKMDLLKRCFQYLCPCFRSERNTTPQSQNNKVSSNYWRTYICKQVSCSNNYPPTIITVITQPLFSYILNSGGDIFSEIL